MDTQSSHGNESADNKNIKKFLKYLKIFYDAPGSEYELMTAKNFFKYQNQLTVTMQQYSQDEVVVGDLFARSSFTLASNPNGNNNLDKY